MSLTVAEVRSALSRYSGGGNDFLSRLNETRARLLQWGSAKGTKEQIELTVYADADGNSIVSLPRGFDTILAGAIRSDNVLCTGLPMGVRNSISEFDKMGLGYGALTDNFQEVTGRFAVLNEWTDPMYIKFRFEATESAGIIHLQGQLDGSDVYSLYSSTWIKGEKIAFVGTTAVTSTKKFDAKGFSAVKPITNGRVSVYAVDDAGIETAVALWEPTETVPNLKRYKVPHCSDVSAVSSTTTVTPNQYFTKDEIEALFDASVVINVSSAGTNDLAYHAFFLRVVKIIAAAGSGAYTRKFTLDTSTAKQGATFRIKLDIAASANPTLEFYNDTIAGTLLQTVPGDSSNLTTVTLVFSFDGSAWVYEGRET